jgi:hypothetical protein
MTVVARYPDSTKTSLEQRLRARARERWPQIASLQIRHRGTFSYIDATLTDATTLKLCRLRYVGSASQWQFAIYRASHDDYDESVFFTGLPVGTCQDALDTACGLYLNDPTAWTRPPTNLRARPLSSSPCFGRSDCPRIRPPADLKAWARNGVPPSFAPSRLLALASSPHTHRWLVGEPSRIRCPGPPRGPLPQHPSCCSPVARDSPARSYRPPAPARPVSAGGMARRRPRAGGAHSRRQLGRTSSSGRGGPLRFYVDRCARVR